MPKELRIGGVICNLLYNYKFRLLSVKCKLISIIHIKGSMLLIESGSFTKWGYVL